MKIKLLKAMHIISDLVLFCNNSGAVDYSVRLTPTRDLTTFEIKAEIPDLPPDQLDKLNAALKLTRMHEVEQNYWGLSSEGDSSDLTLVGMMLDQSFAVYEDGILTITAQRAD